MRKEVHPKYTRHVMPGELKRAGVPGNPKLYTQKKPNNKNPFQPKKSVQ